MRNFASLPVGLYDRVFAEHSPLFLAFLLPLLLLLLLLQLLLATSLLAVSELGVQVNLQGLTQGHSVLSPAGELADQVGLFILYAFACNTAAALFLSSLWLLWQSKDRMLTT